MATLKDLANKMKRIADLVTIETSVSGAPSRDNILIPYDLTIKVAKIILKTAIDLTPVDTGKAISNWQIAFEGNSTEREAFFVGKGGITGSECAKAAYRAGQASLKQWDGKVSIHIVNPVAYVTHLNYGTSRRAGLFIIERAVAAGRSYLRGKT